MFRKSSARFIGISGQNTTGRIFHSSSALSRLQQTTLFSTNTSSTKSNRTTGWTEETRNIFHPGDIVTAIRLDYSGYSPNNLLGVTELACHCLGEGREFCQPHVANDGSIYGFSFNVLPRVLTIQPKLRDLYPDISKFSDSLSERDLETIFDSTKKIVNLVKEIEEKFGRIVLVYPFELSKENNNEKVKEKQRNFLDDISINKKVFHVDPENGEIKETDGVKEAEIVTNRKPGR